MYNVDVCIYVCMYVLTFISARTRVCMWEIVVRAVGRRESSAHAAEGGATRTEMAVIYTERSAAQEAGPWPGLARGNGVGGRG